MSLPSQPRRSPSCHSPSRKTSSRSAAEQPVVERLQVEVGLLVGPAGEEDRQLHRPALELALVDEPRAGLASASSRRRRAPCSRGKVAAARGSSWFSMKRTSRCW